MIGVHIKYRLPKHRCLPSKFECHSDLLLRGRSLPDRHDHIRSHGHTLLELCKRLPDYLGHLLALCGIAVQLAVDLVGCP